MLKRNLYFMFILVLLILLLVCFTACKRTDPELTDDGITDSATMPSITKGSAPGEPLHTASLTRLFKIDALTDPEGNVCKVVQGGCAFDGYAYIALNDGNSQSTDSVSAINKYDLETGKLVESYQGIRSSHCNDMTVNPETGELIITHNTPDFTNISIFDLETMEYKETKTLTLEIYGIAYDVYEECYWVGISRSYSYARLDLDFNVVGDVITGAGEEFGTVRQGIDVDENSLYFARYKSNNIIVYDKETKSATKYSLSVTNAEAECVFFDGGNMYVGYYTGNGGVLYKADLSVYETLSAKAETTSFSVNDPYTDAEGVVYSVPQGSCSDGKYLYQMVSNDDKEGYRSALMKIDLESGDVVSSLDGLEVGLSNDLTYNSKTNEILVVHNTPTPNRLSVINAETMEITEMRTIGLSIYALAYDRVKDCYYAGLSGTYDFVCLNTDFIQVGDVYGGYPSGFTRQAMDCDGEYIYFLLSAENSIAIYKTDGSFVNIVSLPAKYGNAQSLCLGAEGFYLGNHLPMGGFEIYTLNLTVGE